MRFSQLGAARVLPTLVCSALPWCAVGADAPAAPADRGASPPSAHPGPAASAAPAPASAAAPAAGAPTSPASPPPPEDDLFEFLGTVDMDDAALVNYLARPAPRGSSAGTPPKKAGPGGGDKS